jgi:hypothetical protein
MQQDTSDKVPVLHNSYSFKVQGHVKNLNKQLCPDKFMKNKFPYSDHVTLRAFKPHSRRS